MAWEGKSGSKGSVEQIGWSTGPERAMVGVNGRKHEKSTWKGKGYRKGMSPGRGMGCG